MEKVILLASLFFLVFATYAQNKGNDCSSAIPYEINSGPVAGYMASPDVYWYTFTLYADYTDVLITTCISETSTNKVTLFSDCSETIIAYGDMCDQGNGNYNETITLANLTPGTYYVSVEGPTGPGTTGAYTFEVSGNTTALTNDLAVTDIRKPVKNFNDNTPISIFIENLGINSQTGFPVSYTFEGDEFTETYNETIEPGDTVEFIFSQTLDLSQEDIYDLSVKVELPDDENSDNNEYLTKINTHTGDHALHFAGDYIEIKNNEQLNFTGSFTIEAWFYADGSMLNGTLISKHANDGSRSGYAIEYDGTNIKAVVGLSNDSWATVSAEVSSEEWHHIAMVYSSSKVSDKYIRLYIDGVYIDYAAFSSFPNIANNYDLYIGNSQFYFDTDNYWEGSIDEVRLWNTGRTAQQIEDNYNLETAPETSGLVAYYNFNRGISEGDNESIEYLPDMTENNIHGKLCNFILEEGSYYSNFFNTCNALDLNNPVPDIENLPDIVEECSNSVIIDQFPTATDYCSGEITATTTDPTSYTGQGIYIIQWDYEDDNGHTAHQTQNVIIQEDETAPVISSSHEDTTIDANENCQAIVPDYTSDVTASDNCTAVDDLIITQTPAAGTLFSGQTNPVTLRVEDEAGNYVEVSFNVADEDNTGPEITSTHDDRQTNADANCEAVLPDYTGDVTASDNCDADLDITQNPTASSTISGATNTVILTVTDDAGNTAEVSFNVEVVDNTNPEITCVDNQTINLSQGESFYAVQGTEFDPKDTADNCGISSVINDFNSTETLAGEEFTAGTYSITWTVIDNAGNTADCSFDLTLNAFVGISDISENGITVYPNPTNGILTITNYELEIKGIHISDIAGKTITNNFQIESFSNFQINISHLQNGVYLLKVETETGVFIEKIIKQ